MNPEALNAQKTKLTDEIVELFQNFDDTTLESLGGLYDAVFEKYSNILNIIQQLDELKITAVIQEAAAKQAELMAKFEALKSSRK